MTEACLLWIGTAPEAIPTVAALQAQLAGWATIPPDIVDRLTRDQQRGHAADPAPAVGAPAPARRWGDPPRPCLTLSRAGATRSPPARDINHTTMEVFPMPTTQIETPYQVITDRILALLEQGTVPWQQPWDSATGAARNLFSQRSYRGINVWLLTAMGLPSPFWATFHQVKAAGGSVRKGEHGVPVVFWKVYDHEDPETGERRSALSCGNIRSSTPPSSTAWPSRRSPCSRTASRPSSDVPIWWTPCRSVRRSCTDTSAPATRPPRIPCIYRAQRASRARKPITPRSCMN